ncbi:MAG TPA: SH3 domain-containing protein [Thermodesulfobacteriota bacterium]|nr:SH3 domain-containing protein [Thermodesulfobacteriota bacterium]
MFLEAEQQEGYPATVNIEEEGSSLVVRTSLTKTWGSLATPNLCGFYDEFGKNLLQAFAKPPIKESVVSFQTPPKDEKGSSPPAAAPVKPSPLPVARGKVIWAYVNLREGPGIRFRIIGKAYLKTTFEILAENPDWMRVRLENGAEGWMSKKAALVSPSTPSPQIPAAASQDSSKTGSFSKLPGPM